MESSARSSAAPASGPPDQPILQPVQAGPVTAWFEPETGFLRYLRLGDHELVRAIYGAVRDDQWNTIPGLVSLGDFDAQKDSFRATFETRCRQGPVAYRWRGTVTGEPTGRVTYLFEGEAESTFAKNRIGLCVLHPILECAGKPFTLERTDGSKTSGVFPVEIAPDSPCRDIRAVAYEPAPGVQVEVRFEGETFEMEDQRNWTDASFKTYSTPLDQPFPVRVHPGNTVRHRVTVSFPGPVRRLLPVVLGRGAQLSIATTPVLPLPRLGLRLNLAEGRADPPWSEREAEAWRALGLSHFQIDLTPEMPHWRQQLAAAGRCAAAANAGVHVALTLKDPAEVDAFVPDIAGAVRSLGLKVHLWLLYSPDARPLADSLVARARNLLDQSGSSALVAAGTRDSFVALNRARPGSEAIALPCFGITPQIHARDNRSLVESLAAQPATVESARRFAPRAVAITPIALAPPGAAADPRQSTLFAAAWTLGSLTRLAATGTLHSLTYFETAGPGGIMAAAAGGNTGEVYPLYHLLADLAGHDRLYPTLSSHPLQTEALTALRGGRRRILVANLLAKPQEVRVKTGTCQARVRYLDASNEAEARRDPERFRAQAGALETSASAKIALRLESHALARVDILD